ncbi:MAG: hypothetical protein FJ104_11010, partial [Deltaproteobacteria bacterium]|nr:hypothetical protein [Deltaproteobacteria bacterium]
MTDRHLSPEATLPPRAERLLRGLGAPERSSLEWEERAAATVALLDTAPAGEVDPAWLAPPLPAEPGEGAFELEPPAMSLAEV